MKFDVNAPTHRKIRRALALGGTDAAWLWFAANCYCRNHLTDGYIEEADLPVAAPGVKPGAFRRAIDALVESGLWHREGSGFRVHGFLEWNPSRLESEAGRLKDRARKRGGLREESARIPDGFQAESARIPDVEKRRESREEESGETARARKHAPGALAGTLPRDHIDHGFCGARFCVKSNHVAELVRRYGADGNAAVPAWLTRLDDGLGPTDSPGGWVWVLQQFDAWLQQTGRLRGPRPVSAVPDEHETRRQTEAIRARAGQ